MQESKDLSLLQKQHPEPLQKKLSQEEKLKLYKDAKYMNHLFIFNKIWFFRRRSQKSSSYSTTHRSFQDMLRVYDSPKQQIKAVSCKKDFRSSSVEPESLNFSFLSETDKNKANVSDTKVSDDFLISPPQTAKSQSLSAILDEENEKSNESETSPYFGFARSSKPKKRKGFDETNEPKDDQENKLPSSHQLKKVLTEENQLQKTILPSYSFQKILPQTTCSEIKEEIKNDLIVNSQDHVEEKDLKIEDVVLESSKKLKIEKKKPKLDQKTNNKRRKSCRIKGFNLPLRLFT